MIAVILTGGARMAAGHLQVAEFAAFLLYLLQTVPSVNTLATGFGRAQAGLAARDRCNELLALPREADPDDDVRPTPTPVPGAPAVVFRGVSYTHAGDRAARPGLRLLQHPAHRPDRRRRSLGRGQEHRALPRRPLRPARRRIGQHPRPRHPHLAPGFTAGPDGLRRPGVHPPGGQRPGQPPTRPHRHRRMTANSPGH